MDDNTYCVYMAINVRNRKSYIGRTNNIKRRIGVHKWSINNKDTHFSRSLRKHGMDGFIWMILKEGLDSKDEANRYEKEHIRISKMIGIELYNITDGGDGPSIGHYVSEETRRKIGLKKLNTKHSDEAKRKMSLAHQGKGHPITEEQKNKTRNTLLGHSVSEDTRMKISITKKNQHKKLTDEHKRKMKETKDKRTQEQREATAIKRSHSLKEAWIIRKTNNAKNK